MTRYEALKLIDFIAESNRIEGIEHEPVPIEIEAHRRLLDWKCLTLIAVEDFVFEICGEGIRSKLGMDVRVGSHPAPQGGPEVKRKLELLLKAINIGRRWTPFEAHVRYVLMHPFMDGNGRSGRAIWAWQMQQEGHDPFALPFLHRFYYQALDAQRGGER